MKKSDFTETQIIGILGEADAGLKVQDICRKHGISPATFHRWKSKYGGMDASELRRVKELPGGHPNSPTCGHLKIPHLA